MQSESQPGFLSKSRKSCSWARETAAFFAEDHVGVKAALVFRGERPHPTHSFSTERINVGIVFYPEWNILSMFGKHNAPPSADVQEGQCRDLRAISIPSFRCSLHRSQIVNEVRNGVEFGDEA